MGAFGVSYPHCSGRPPTEEWLQRARSPFPFDRRKRNSGRIPLFVPGVSRGRTHAGFGLSGGARFDSTRTEKSGSANRRWAGRDSSSERSRRVTEDPRRFFRLFETALRPTDIEVIDAQIQIFLAARQEPESGGSDWRIIDGQLITLRIGSALSSLLLELRASWRIH